MCGQKIYQDSGKIHKLDSILKCRGARTEFLKLWVATQNRVVVIVLVGYIKFQ